MFSIYGYSSNGSLWNVMEESRFRKIFCVNPLPLSYSYIYKTSLKTVANNCLILSSQQLGSFCREYTTVNISGTRYWSLDNSSDTLVEIYLIISFKRT